MENPPELHYAIEVVTLGDYADPRNVVELAQAAEAAGWEGLFVWDHIGSVWGAPAADPWVVLAAAAATTRRLKLVSSVTPLPRRRPQVVAQTLVSLDKLSEGRVILGVGLGGAVEEFSAFGERAETSMRAAMLDEGLEILDCWMRGETVMHHGAYYQVENVPLLPMPVQKPRIPIWIGGESAPALRRAARWDGWIVGGAGQDLSMVKTPVEISAAKAYILDHRSSSLPFEIAMTGYSQPGEHGRVEEYGEAGVTWWVESLNGYRGSPEDMLDRVKAGPPAG